MSLPEAIAKSIEGVKPWEQFRLRASSAPFYADTMTTDSFNTYLSSCVLLLKGQYGYVDAMHEDWVSSHVVHSGYEVCEEGYEEGEKKGPKEYRLLDSWSLKMPVSFVPEKEELLEEMEWRKDNGLLLANLRPKALTVEMLQECYITASCYDVLAHNSLLKRWVLCGRPIDQRTAATPDGRVFLVQKSKQQNINRRAAATTAQKLSVWRAPQFMLDRAFGRVVYEEDVLNQIREALRLYR